MEMFGRNTVLVIGAILIASIIFFGCVSAMPKNPSAKQVPGGILISWSAPDSTGVIGYNVYRSTKSADLGTKINPVSISSLTYSDTNVRDGVAYYYTVRTINAGGSEDGNNNQVGVTAKTIPPTNEHIDIENGLLETNSSSVSLDLSAIGASECRLSNDGITWTDWKPYAKEMSWTLTANDGPKMVYYQCRDDVGNMAQPVSAGIELDMTPPTITIKSPTSGGMYGGGFDLVFAASDPTHQTMTCSGDLDGSPIAIGIVDSNKDDTTSVISKEGQHTLKITCSDGVNSAEKSVSFTVVNKPTVTINIESGAGYTDTTLVTLNVTAIPTASECRFSNDQNAWGSWTAYGGSKEYKWTLSSGDGTKIVYAQCRNQGGQVSDTVSDSIILDTSPPPYISITINNDNQWTDSRTVILGLYSFSARMCRYSNDDLSWTDYEPYTTSRGWTLSQGFETKTVYYECKDKNGEVIGTASNSIIYSDREPNPPSNLRVKINGGASYTSSPDVTFSLRADNADECRLRENNNGWTGWSSYRTSMDWTLNSGDGRKTIYYQCRNDFGSSSESASIYLETGPPGKITDLYASPSMESIRLRWSRPTDTGSGISSYHIYRSNVEFGLFSLLASSYSPSYTDYNVVGGETYAYSVRAVDASENEGPDSNIVSATPGLLTGDASAN